MQKYNYFTVICALILLGIGAQFLARVPAYVQAPVQHDPRHAQLHSVHQKYNQSPNYYRKKPFRRKRRFKKRGRRFRRYRPRYKDQIFIDEFDDGFYKSDDYYLIFD